MQPNDLLISTQVLDYLLELPSEERWRLRKRFAEIRDYPERFSDFEEYSPNGRLLDCHVMAKHSFLYWHDPADRHVKTLHARPSDRS